MLNSSPVRISHLRKSPSFRLGSRDKMRYYLIGER